MQHKQILSIFEKGKPYSSDWIVSMIGLKGSRICELLQEIAELGYDLILPPELLLISGYSTIFSHFVKRIINDFFYLIDFTLLGSGRISHPRFGYFHLALTKFRNTLRYGT